jgi:glutamate synthase (NADPH/NADH) small chain
MALRQRDLSRWARRPTPSSAARRRGWHWTQRGFIAADAQTQATSLRGVFAGGDIVTGGATVILAMAAGRRAARAIGHWLQGDRAAWPPQLPAAAIPEAQPAAAAASH